MDADIERHLTEIDKSILAEFDFAISSSGDRFVVRDPQNKKLGGKGRLEGGNLTSLLVKAKAERVAVVKAAPKAKKPKAATTPAEPKQAAPRASDAPVVVPVETAKPARNRPARKYRDMSAMNAVYDAVLMGMQPMDCYDKLSADGVRFVSKPSVYTHAAIAKRVRDRAFELGWLKPEEKEKQDEAAPKGN